MEEKKSFIGFSSIDAARMQRDAGSSTYLASLFGEKEQTWNQKRMR
jgi:hypothetical protein